MANVEDRMGVWLDCYGRVAQEGLNRLRKARKALNEATYEPKHLFSDLLYFWVDGPLDLFTAAFRSGDTAVPTIFLKTGEDSDALAGSVRVDAPQGKLTCTDLVRLGAAGELQAKTHVVAVLKDQNELEVRLKGLKDVNLKGGQQYLGCAFVDKTLLAYIHVVVL